MVVLKLIIVGLLLSSVNAIRDACLGNGFTCFLTNDNQVYCVGSNNFGQLGISNSIKSIGNSLADWPLKSVKLSTVVQIACGNASVCALLSDKKSLYCWGQAGMTGNGLTTNVYVPNSPVSFDGLSILDFGVGTNAACALLSDHSVRCWGNNDQYGSVGYGNTNSYLTPGPPVNISSNSSEHAVGLSVGAFGTIILTTSGNVIAWGLNDYGQLGIGSYQTIGPNPTDFPPVPSTVANPLARYPVKVIAGFSANCIIYNDNYYACAGRGNSGETDYGSTSNSGDFTLLHLTKVGNVSCANQRCCLIPFPNPGITPYPQIGQVACIGTNSIDQLGFSPPGGIYGTLSINSSPNTVNLDNTFQLVYGPTSFTSNCVLAYPIIYEVTSPYAQVFCFGGQTYGELGLGIDASIVPLTNDPFVNRVRVLCGNGIVETSEGEECDIDPGESTLELLQGNNPRCSAYCQLVCQAVQPNPEAICQNGVWVLANNLSISGNLLDYTNTSIVIVGNFSLSNNSILIVNENTNISVNGCVILNGTLEIDGNYSNNSVITPFTSKCIVNSLQNIVVSSACQKGVGSIAKTPYSSMLDISIVNNDSCNTEKNSNNNKFKIIIACVIGGTALLIVGVIIGGYFLHKKYQLALVFRSRENASRDIWHF